MGEGEKGGVLFLGYPWSWAYSQHHLLVHEAGGVGSLAGLQAAQLDTSPPPPPPPTPTFLSGTSGGIFFSRTHASGGGVGLGVRVGNMSSMWDREELNTWLDTIRKCSERSRLPEVVFSCHCFLTSGVQGWERCPDWLAVLAGHPWEKYHLGHGRCSD